LDGELDPTAALRIQDHLSVCRSCSTHLERLGRLRDEIAAADLDWSAGVDLRALETAARKREPGMRRAENDSQPWWRRLQWHSPQAMAAALFAIAVLTTVFVVDPWNARVSSIEQQQILDSHVRSMMAEHLVDVPSSDRHTVKPWFQGRLNFAPAVPDLAGDGFVLAGGRLDVIEGKPAAALVYRRRSHIINLWIRPVDAADSGIASTTREGFHLLSWKKKRMLYWAVSDLNPLELREFAEAVLRAN
jgi:anti-sigma factor RsiW